MTIIPDAPAANSRAQRVVYLAAPLQTYGTSSYHQALRFIKQRYPLAEILEAASLFSDRDDWLASYRQRLADVTTCYILTDPDSCVGRGVYDEWKYLHQRGVAIVALPPASLRVPNPTLLVIEVTNWQRYAIVMPPGLLPVLRDIYDCWHAAVKIVVPAEHLQDDAKESDVLSFINANDLRTVVRQCWTDLERSKRADMLTHTTRVRR